MKIKTKMKISILLVFMLVVNLFSSVNLLKVNAENLNSNKITIRVEGKDNTLFNKEIEITNELVIKDLIEKSIGKDNIKGLDKGFITEVLGEKEESNIGWMYYLVDKDGDIRQGDIVTKEKTKDSKGRYYKELVLHMCKYIGGITCIPKITYTNSNNKYTLKITEQNVMMDIDERPASNVNVKIDGVGEYKTNESGEVRFKIKYGENKISIYKNLIDLNNVEYPGIVRKSFSLIGNDVQKDNNIEKVIDELNNSCVNGEELNYKKILALNFYNKTYSESFKLEDINNASSCASNVMGILALRKNPYNYNGVNYVEKLLKAENSDGEFIIGKNDKGSATTLATCITALDMAKAEYNKENSIKKLKTEIYDNGFEDIDIITSGMIALSNYKNIDEVENLIDECIKSLKNKQLEGGGFDYCEMGNSPYATAQVIQALIAIGEDVTSLEWSKKGGNPLEALLACKLEKNGFELAEGSGLGYDETATEYALLALVDVYREESVYKNFCFEKDDNKDYKKIIINEIRDISDYFKVLSDYDYNTALSFSYLNFNKNEFMDKVVLKDKDNALSYAQNVMSIIAVGKNPRNYNGKNYVDLLINKLKNNKNNKSDIYGLIALTMSDAKEDDINELVSKLKKSEKKIKQVGDKALLVIALSPYKEDNEIKDLINEHMKEIKNKQLENGGFTLSKRFPNGDSEDTALAIEAIIAYGQDPLSSEWSKNGKNPLDALLSFKMGKGYIYESSLGIYEQQMYTASVLRAIIALKDNNIIFNKFKLDYEESKDNTTLVKNSLDDMRKYYEGKDKLGFKEVLALNFSSDNISNDIKKIEGRYKVRDNCKGISDYAANIMGLIATWKNPKKYNEINYVECLKDSQVKFGENKGKFIVSNSDEIYPTAQAYAVMALDMANVDYDKESAIKALCKMSNNGFYEDIDTTAMVITALASHKDINGANEVICSSLKYLNEKQNEKGGYNAYGKENNVCTIATVIQALVANDIDIFENMWIKNNNTLLDAILNQKINGQFGNDFANSEVFMALADLNKNVSMFKEIKMYNTNNIKTAIEDIKIYYENNQNKYNYIQSLALNNIGFNKEFLINGIQLSEEEPSILNYDTKTTKLAKNVISIKSSGFNCKNYKGKNYIDELLNCQLKDGSFKLKDDKNSIKSTAYSIIALDLCNENYDLKAIDMLIYECNDLSEKTIDDMAFLIIALSNHRNINGVDESIENCVKQIKKLQCDDGGFGYSIKKKDEKSSEYTSKAILALNMAGEDLLSVEWMKNGKTPIDNLLTYKRNNYFIYDSLKENYNEYTNEATGLALASLVSVYNNKNIFKAQNYIDGLIITNNTKAEQFIKGKDAKIDFKVLNKNKIEEDITITIGVYDKNNKLINYKILKEKLQPNTLKEFEKEISLPIMEESNVKIFIWDNFEKMNSKKEFLKIEIK